MGHPPFSRPHSATEPRTRKTSHAYGRGTRRTQMRCRRSVCPRRSRRVRPTRRGRRRRPARHPARTRTPRRREGSRSPLPCSSDPLGRAVKRIFAVAASAAEHTAAEALRRRGYDGTPPLIDYEPRPPYDRPPLPKQFLTGRWAIRQAALRPTADLDAPRLGLRPGTATTGLAPVPHTVQPTIPSAVLRTSLALRDRRGPGHRLLVVGAGFLGAENTGIEVGRIPSPVHLRREARPRTGAVPSEAAEAKAAPGNSAVVEVREVLVANGSRPDIEWLAVRDRGRVTRTPGHARRARGPRRPRHPHGSNTAPTPPIQA